MTTTTAPPGHVMLECPQCGQERAVRKHRAASHPDSLCRHCHGRRFGAAQKTGTENTHYRGTAHIPMSRYSRWRANARHAGRKWTLTIDEIEQLYQRQHGRCALTGEELVYEAHESHRNDPRVISLDRIDNERPYTPSNVRMTTWRANRIKHTMTDAELADFCRAILARQESGKDRRAA